MEKLNQITEGNGPVNSRFRCGSVALAGRSNVGKSTLLNRLLGTKIAIETDKPQATRTRILGIRTLPSAQLVWIDLPGIHRARSMLNRRMVDTARRSIGESDAVVVVLDATTGLVGADEDAIGLAAASGHSWLLALNKIDRVSRNQLLTVTAAIHARFPDHDIVPVSARTGENLDELERSVAKLLPEGSPLYPEDDLTDQTQRAIAQETVREKIYGVTGEEVPYRTAVVIDAWTEKPSQNLVVIQATIVVERDSQKRIVIGKGGARIREIGQQARRELETLLERRVFLELFVKVQREWTKNPRALDELGI